jgi:hypothetical protein
MTEPSLSRDEIDALRAVAEPLNKILSLQRFRMSQSMLDELGVTDDGHSTQSNHCSSGSVACQIPFTDEAVTG